LPEYDYRQPGSYFVTICTHDRECLLGSVEEGIVTISSVGQIVEKCWLDIPEHFSNVQLLDEHIIMPNHTHGIINILDCECRGQAFADQISSEPSIIHANASPRFTDNPPNRGTKAGSLAAIIQNFKSITSRQVNKIMPCTLWQRGYYEHVIRNDQALAEIREYIASNPWNWQTDEYHK
jgi:REP element-mobilizing transposase RayT